MHGPQRKMLLSVSVVAVLSAPLPVTAQPSPADRAQQKATMFRNMQNTNPCSADMARMNQAGTTDADRVQIMRDCAAKQGQTFQPNDMQRGVELERAGRYAEAAAAYQAHLNASGHPDGDGYVAGERLGFMYANGRGVPNDLARARTLFSANTLPRNRIDLGLLNHGMLPQTPEGKTPDLVARISQILDHEEQAHNVAMMREMMERAEQLNKASPRQGASGSNPYSSSCRQMVANGHNMIAGSSGCVPW